MTQRLHDKRKEEARCGSRVMRIGPNHDKNGDEHAAERNPKRPEFAIAQGERKSRKHEQHSQPAKCGCEALEFYARNVQEAFPRACVFFALPDVEELFEAIVVEMFFRKGFLPDKWRQTFISAFIQSVRKKKYVAGKAPVVVAHEDKRGQKNKAKRNDN